MRENLIFNPKTNEEADDEISHKVKFESNIVEDNISQTRKSSVGNISHTSHARKSIDNIETKRKKSCLGINSFIQ